MHTLIFSRFWPILSGKNRGNVQKIFGKWNNYRKWLDFAYKRTFLLVFVENFCKPPLRPMGSASRTTLSQTPFQALPSLTSIIPKNSCCRYWMHALKFHGHLFDCPLSRILPLHGRMSPLLKIPPVRHNASIIPFANMEERDSIIICNSKAWFILRRNPHERNKS